MSAVAPSYEIRSQEQTLLYSVVASELETFLAEQRSAEHGVPCFVEREFRAFLECGVLSRGFLRVHCGSCGMDRVVGFSCKKRGWCPSCGGRRIPEIRSHPAAQTLPAKAPAAR
jgi:ribosomal protein S27E